MVRMMMEMIRDEITRNPVDTIGEYLMLVAHALGKNIGVYRAVGEPAGGFHMKQAVKFSMEFGEFQKWTFVMEELSNGSCMAAPYRLSFGWSSPDPIPGSLSGDPGNRRSR